MLTSENDPSATSAARRQTSKRRGAHYFNAIGMRGRACSASEAVHQQDRGGNPQGLFRSRRDTGRRVEERLSCFASHRDPMRQAAVAPGAHPFIVGVTVSLLTRGRSYWGLWWARLC